MRLSFLPIKVKEQLKSIAGAATPAAISRTNGSLEGGPGESYVVTYDDKIVILSRALGKSDYSVIHGDLAGGVGELNLSKEGPSALVLSYDIGGKKGKLKFSAFDEKSLETAVEKWKSAGNGGTPSGESAAEVSPEEPPSEALPPMMAMAAALMYVAAVDGEVAKEENRYIANLRGIDKEGLDTALAYYRSHSFEELLQSSLSNLSEEQNLCVLANMLEVGMSDGVLHKSEIKLAKEFGRSVGIDSEKYSAVKQVLLVKNKISVLLT